MRGSVVILSGNHLCHNPRVVKEASALGGAGYEVRILGARVDSSLAERDEALQRELPARFAPVLDLASSKGRQRLVRLTHRVRGKASGAAKRWLGVDTPRQLGAATRPMLDAARGIDADLYIAHSEAGMFVARELRRSGKTVAVDMEDWYSEDLLPEVRSRRPIRLLRDLEEELLRHSACATCPSEAMSVALARAFACRPPTVIYNAFPWSDRARIDGLRKDRGDSRRVSIHWFSQTLGRGRGLEDLFAALAYVGHEAEVHLRGQPVAGFIEWMSTVIPSNWRERVFIHELVANDELLSRIAEHDIGFAGEMKYAASRDLTVTNKVLQYLLAGLAVVASDTSGQREVAARAQGAVALYPSGDARALAGRIDASLGDSERLEAAKAAALRSAKDLYCWERQSEQLLATIKEALEAPVSKAHGGG